VNANLVRFLRILRWTVPGVILAITAVHHACAQTDANLRQHVDMALDQYTAAKTEDQRATVIDYLQHMDHKLVAADLVDHLIASRNGTEATIYNQLVEALKPDGCAAVLDRLEIADEPTTKGKLIVALRHCQGNESLKALQGCLEDKRPVPFEVHGTHPRRVCDMAYDELYLKLRNDEQYGLDASPRMQGIITEKTPEQSRDDLIAKLKSKLAKKSPVPSTTPVPPKPATAAITLL